jgi:hypothetical protein
MKIAILGSEALSYHTELERTPKDVDIVGEYDDVVNYIRKVFDGHKFSIYPIASGKKIVAKTVISGKEKIIEAEIAWPGSSAEKLFNLIKNDSSTKATPTVAVPSLNILYMLKMSHRYLKNAPSFLKTMKDIRFMREIGAFIQENHQEFYEGRMKETYSYAHPTLNKNKQEFFAGDGVTYVYEHDSIHESMKQMDRPAYTYFKDDQKEVWCSKEKFFDCDFEIRLNAVLEESLVLALERSQIPFPNVDPDKSFKKALEKVCTSITSGWFREFAWENYDQVMYLYKMCCRDYVSQFWSDVESGVVRKL